MYRTIAPSARGRTWRLAAVLGTVLLLTLFAGAQLVSADAEGVVDTACVNQSPCNANDMQIASIKVTNVPVCQVEDDPSTPEIDLYADVTFEATILVNAKDRYDVGLWVALEGGSAQSGPGNQCYRGILRPLETATNLFNPIFGPFRDLDVPSDYCGDATSDDPSLQVRLQTLHVKCTDTTGTGYMSSISTCVTWEQSKTWACAGPLTSAIGDSSKCRCGPTPIDPPIPLQQLVVRKVTEPSPDPYSASFDFTVTGPNSYQQTFSRGNGGSWASGALPVGSPYSVTEVRPPGWDQLSAVCTDGFTTYQPDNITMAANRSVECVFTNKIQRGKIIVDKITNPSSDTTLFDFALTGGPTTTGYPLNRTFQLAHLTTPYDSLDILPTTGTSSTYVVTETPVSGWYTWSSCTDGVNTFGADVITVDPGETVNCVFSNSFGPTAVEIVDFTATGDKRVVTLEWETASDLDTLGFNVYRAKKVDGPRTKLNEELIPADYGNPLGAVYTFKDTTMLGARTYYYWLETVDGSEATELHGPVESRAKKVKFEQAAEAPVQ